MATEAPFGSWSSPITAELVGRAPARLVDAQVDRDGSVYWSEARPTEGGRVALVRRRPDGTVDEVSAPGANVRTRVHEYGGGAWRVERGVVVAVDFASQALWRTDVATGAPAVRLTPPPAAGMADRFADGRFSPDGRWFVCVREHHGASGRAIDVDNDLVAVALDGSQRVVVLMSGADFYAAPRFSPDGTRLAWLEWHHPDMPWDHTELWVAELALGDTPRLRAPWRAAGADEESIVQPEWSPEGVLHFCSDRGEWWNLCCVDGERRRHDVVRGPFEIVRPPWVFGESRYCFTDEGLVYARRAGAADELVFDDAVVPLPYTSLDNVVPFGDRVIALAASYRHDAAVVAIDRAGACTALSPVPDNGLAEGWFAPPELVEFDSGDTVARALFYAPANPDFTGVPGERPPLVVMAHGGPTSAARTQLSLGVRFWTSRGFAVVDVDYRGSSGYGRTYRTALDRGWGVVDVADCVAAALALADRGRVDRERLAIRGGSAGGFTVLCALTFHPGVFRAGASHYGIADLEALATDTHKFESRYLDRLVGPYPAERARYVERSPIHHVERLATPMIVLQGLDDRVVPPNQAEMMVAALAARGVPHAYVAFAGEGHGFRQAAHIVRALEAEASFYAQIFGITLADAIEPVPIARGDGA